MSKHCIEIQNLPYTNKFNKEIEAIIKGKINPSVEKLKKELESSKDKLVLKIVQSIPTLQTGGIFGLSVLVGLPMGIAFGLASGYAFISSFLEHKTRIREIKRENGLGIFLSM